MMRKKQGANGMAIEASLHFANRNATKAAKADACLHFANGPNAGRHLETACARLQDAATELETLLAHLSGPSGKADLHEAIGSIMETMQLIASAHARLGPSAALD